MKDSCAATERSYGLDRPVLSGPGAWAATDNPCGVGEAGGPSDWEVMTWGQEQRPLFPTKGFFVLPAQFLSAICHVYYNFFNILKYTCVFLKIPFYN